MRFRPSEHFKAFASSLEVWLDGSIMITRGAYSERPTEHATSLGHLAEPEFLCAVCLRFGIFPRLLERPPSNVETVVAVFHSLNFQGR